MKLEGILKQSYGDRIDLKYIDTRITGFEESPLIFRVSQMGYPFPIIAVNGQPKFAGAVNEEDIRQLIDEIMGAA